jgi:hypothetical protein
MLEAESQQHNNQAVQEVFPTPETNIDWGALFLSSEDIHNDLIANMISPGAGLIDVDEEDNSDQIFDDIFMPDGSAMSGGDEAQGETYAPLTRSYQGNDAILNAYYIYVHPYFPILPAPATPVLADLPTSQASSFEPVSPLVMALLAILVLIPHPDDEYPESEEAVCLRRQRAHSYSQMTMETIEIETELLESTTSPSAALDHHRPSIFREKFHPHVPVELESVLAHVLLSIYEYAQRGNLAKMRNRASQAYDAAIRLCLHDISDIPLDDYTEARRRTWWMTYIVVLQSSIVSSTPPIISIDFHQFRTPLPTSSADGKAWAFFIEAQQCILRCTQYTAALKKTLEGGMDDSALDQRKAMLENNIDEVLQKYASPTTNLVVSPAMDAAEHTLVTSLRSQALIKLSSARIKLHRYRAFRDVPIFTRRHCDLDQADTSSPRPLGCSCHSALPAASYRSTDGASTGAREISISDQAAAKICLKAALAIGRAFESLPYPNPAQLPLSSLSPPTLSTFSATVAPRTMPSFACCAMQSCYTLLTLCYKSLEMRCFTTRSPTVDKGLEELYAGVDRVLKALQNYAIAFEALSGMTREFAYHTPAYSRLSANKGARASRRSFGSTEECAIARPRGIYLGEAARKKMRLVVYLIQLNGTFIDHPAI